MSQGYRESGEEDRSILVVAFGDKVFGLNARDGSIAWHHRMPGLHGLEVLVEDERIYVASRSALSIFEYPSGRQLHSVKMPGQYRGRPTMVMERGYLFVGSGGEVCCFSREAELMWEQGFPGKGLGHVALGFPGNMRQADMMGS